MKEMNMSHTTIMDSPSVIFKVHKITNESAITVTRTSHMKERHITYIIMK